MSKDNQNFIKNLNNLLSSYHVLYMNVRGYHWNVKGPQFFSLHEKFEDFYKDLQVQIDDIAERILALGGKPGHSFSTFLENSSVKEKTNIFKGEYCVSNLLSDLNTIIEEQKTLVVECDEINDQRTADQLNSYIFQQEKLCWMFESFLE